MSARGDTPRADEMSQLTLLPPPELSRGVRSVLVGSVVSSKCPLLHCVPFSSLWYRLICFFSGLHRLWVTVVACRACGATAAFVYATVCVLTLAFFAFAQLN